MRFHIREYISNIKNALFRLFPFKHIWRCHKIDQAQTRVIIYITYSCSTTAPIFLEKKNVVRFCLELLIKLMRSCDFSIGRFMLWRSRETNVLSDISSSLLAQIDCTNRRAHRYLTSWDKMKCKGYFIYPFTICSAKYILLSIINDVVLLDIRWKSINQSLS